MKSLIKKYSNEKINSKEKFDDLKEDNFGAYITKCDYEKPNDSESILSGVPVCIKDNIAVNGVKMTCASAMLENFIPDYDAEAVARLKKCGAVIVAKTNMDEFGMGDTSKTSHFGAVSNPKFEGYYAGGSSAGSAAAVAGELCAYALGSDTGGSVRVPAAFCGVFGLCPTYGAVSRYGLVSYASSLDRIGIIASCPDDIKEVFAVISGKDEKDMTSREIPYLESIPLEKLKIAYPEAPYYEDEASREYFEKTLEKLEKKGVRLQKTDLGFFDGVSDIYNTVAFSQSSSNLGRYTRGDFDKISPYTGSFAENTAEIRERLFGETVKERIKKGAEYLMSGKYEEALLKVSEIKKSFDKIFEEFDLLLTPVSPGVCPKFGGELSLPDYYTCPSSLAGLPSGAFPYVSIPSGAQLIGKEGAEYVICRAMEELCRE